MPAFCGKYICWPVEASNCGGVEAFTLRGPIGGYVVPCCLVEKSCSLKDDPLECEATDGGGYDALTTFRAFAVRSACVVGIDDCSIEVGGG